VCALWVVARAGRRRLSESLWLDTTYRQLPPHSIISNSSSSSSLAGTCFRLAELCASILWSKKPKQLLIFATSLVSLSVDRFSYNNNNYYYYLGRRISLVSGEYASPRMSYSAKFVPFRSIGTSTITEICLKNLTQKKIWSLASRLSRSLTINVTDTDRSATYDFPLTFHGNHGPISYRSARDGNFSRKSQIPPPPCTLRPRWMVPLGIGYRRRDQKTRMMGLTDGKKEVWPYLQPSR